MDTSNLFKKNSDIGDMLTRSALSDRSILTEMFKYFSISDLQYFWKSDLYFCQISIFWFPKFLSIWFVLNLNVQTTGSVLPSLGTDWIGCKFGHKMAPPAICKQKILQLYDHPLFTILATRWSYLHWLQIWPPEGATCISCKLSHHNLHWFKIWTWGFPTSIGSKVGHQVVSHALPHCPLIALLALSVGIDLVSSSARVTSVKSQYKDI